MSTKEMQKRRKKEREKLHKTPSTEYPRRKTSGKVRDGQTWVPLPSDQKFRVPVGKTEKYPAEIGNILRLWSEGAVTGGLIAENTLYAIVTSAESVVLGEHVPQHADSIYLHPETMRCCGIAIAQAVAVRNSAEGVLVVCKAWPVAKLELDEVVLGSTVMLGCHGNPGDLVELRRISKPSQLPVASKLQLQPCSEVNFPLNESFKSYLLHMHDGHYVCPGNYLAVPFYGERRTFKAVQVTSSSDQPAYEDLFSDSILDSMSELSLNHTPSKHCAPNFSTPKTDSSVAAEAGLEPNLPDGSLLELEWDPVYLSSVTKYHSLPENQSSASRSPGTVRAEVIVHKLTTKTKIQFVDALREGEEQNKVPPSCVGGLRRQTQLLQELVLYPLETPDAVHSKGLWFPRGVLLYGPAGVGKSLLARAMMEETRAHVIAVSATDLLLGLHDSESRLQEVFREARENSPCLLVLDDLHDLCPHRDLSPSEEERRATASLATLMDQLNRTPPPAHVVVMATTNQIERVESSLRRPGRFDKEVEISVPTASERKEILAVLLRGTEHCVSEEEITKLADTAHGYVGADLYAVCLEAQHKALKRSLDCGGGCEGVRVTGEDMNCALKEVRPSAMREVAVEVPKVLWSDIGGQEELKQKLRESVEWPLKHPEAFARLGISPPRGVLLYGPPGCSKTMIARALATESGLNFIGVKGPELFSKWVGDSERAVRQVFGRARSAAPAIIFFDEIDALAVQRKSEGSAVADRVLAQLLTEMDGVEHLREVLVVAATNRPDMIDKALLRPGRIDRMIYVPLPSANTRREILQLQFRRTPVSSDVDLEDLVSQTAGFSGAEMVSLCQEAALCAMHEDIAVEQVSQRYFQEALAVVKPQTDQSTLQFFDSYSKSGGTKATL